MLRSSPMSGVGDGSTRGHLQTRRSLVPEWASLLVPEWARSVTAILLAVASMLAFTTVASAVPLGIEGSASTPAITSDQSDYLPGSTVTLTGESWQPGESVHVFVNDGIGQTWSHNSSPDPVADGGGVFTYSFQLPTSFVATYSVTATGPVSGVATTTFTDGPVPANVSLLTWKTSPSGDWIQGTLNANNSDYAEGETVPFRLELGTLATSGNPYTAPVCRDYQLASGVFGYTILQPFNTSRAATAGGTVSSTSGPFSGVNLTITGVNETGTSAFGGFDCGSTQRLTIVTFNVSASGPQFLLWGGRLASPVDPGVGSGKSASFWTGGSLQMRLASPDKTAGINPDAVIQLGKITVTKVVDSGSATPDQWCFNISPNPNNETLPKCIPSGQSSVDFLGLATGSYSITETTVSGYAFASGSGTNCTFSGSTATASVTAAAGGASNASCTFHNAQNTGSLKITKSFDANGSGFAGDFSIGYDCNDGTSNDGTVTLAAGASLDVNGIPTGTECTVSEPSTPTPPTGWSFGTPTTNPTTAPSPS